ncbi:MAG: J domain-containing protein [Anaerolineae bacterium]
MPPVLPDYYAVLQVSPTAETAIIEAAYRQLARLYHPDVNPAPGAKERMQAINAAYEVLGDPQRRAEYDAARAARLKAGARLLDVERDGEWIGFRLGPAHDPFATLAALRASIPPDGRHWDAMSQRWRVHADYGDVLGRLFVNYGAPSALAHTETPPETPRSALPQFAALGVCLIAAALLVYLANTPTGLMLRSRATNAVVSLAARVDPGVSGNLAVGLLAALAIVALGAIVWYALRPSPRR